jgi:type IV secretory pathway TrbF-like protein
MATATVATQLPSADDEYLAARREWRDRYSDLAAGKRDWQLAALGFFLIAAMTSAATIIQVRQVSHWIALVHTQSSAEPGQDLNNPAGIQIVASQWARETFPPAEAQ